jgi:hypothetical protein
VHLDLRIAPDCPTLDLSGVDEGNSEMYIGGGICLMVVGGILAFGVKDNVNNLDLGMVGWVCIAGGILAIVLSLILGQQRANTSHTEVVERRDIGNPPGPRGY